MAKRGNDTFTPSGWNGADPNPRKSNAFADSDPVSPNAYDYTPYAGDGNKSGRQFQDADDMYTLEGFNIIDSRDPNYAGSASGAKLERNSVDVSKADRGRES